MLMANNWFQFNYMHCVTMCGGTMLNAFYFITLINSKRYELLNLISDKAKPYMLAQQEFGGKLNGE